MSRPGTSPRSKSIRSSTASPLLSPTGPPCRKTSSPVDTNQVSAMLSRFTARKPLSEDGSETASSDSTDYILTKPYDYFSVTKTGKQKIKTSSHGSGYVSFPEFDQYQRRDGITTDAH